MKRDAEDAVAAVSPTVCRTGTSCASAITANKKTATARRTDRYTSPLQLAAGAAESTGLAANVPRGATSDISVIAGVGSTCGRTDDGTCSVDPGRAADTTGCSASTVASTGHAILRIVTLTAAASARKREDRSRTLDPGCSAPAATCAVAHRTAIAPASESAGTGNANDAAAASAPTDCHRQRFTRSDGDEASDICATTTWISDAAATSCAPRFNEHSGYAIGHRECLDIAGI